MDVLVLIDKLDDLVHSASTLPMTDKVMIDRDQIYDLLGFDALPSPKRSNRRGGL